MRRLCKTLTNLFTVTLQRLYAGTCQAFLCRSLCCTRTRIHLPYTHAVVYFFPPSAAAQAQQAGHARHFSQCHPWILPKICSAHAFSNSPRC